MCCNCGLFCNKVYYGNIFVLEEKYMMDLFELEKWDINNDLICLVIVIMRM